MHIPAVLRPRGAFLIVIFLPLSIIYLMQALTAPGNPIPWLMVLVSAIVVAVAVAWSFTRYRTSARGIIRRRFFRDTLMPWEEVEAVGKQVVRQRYSNLWAILRIYSRAKTYAITMRHWDNFERVLQAHCPHSVWINEEKGTFDVPQMGDQEKIHEIVRRHARRLRRTNIAVGLGLLVIFAPLVAAAASGNFDGLWPVVVICTVMYGAFSAPVWATVWRLRS